MNNCVTKTESSSRKSLKTGFVIDRVPFIAGDGTSNRMYLPLCAKAKTVALFQRRPQLLYQTIVDTLLAESGDLLIFIADGEVMVQAMMMNSSRSKSERKVAEVAVQIKEHVERTLAVLALRRPDLAGRIAGVIDWAEAAAAETAAQTIETLRGIMRNPDMEVNPPTTAALKAGLGETGAKIWESIRRLVRNLYTQRSAGTSLADVFAGEGLSIKSEPKLVKRYRALEESCVLELSVILAGFECGGITYTEMRYLTPNPQGMTHIGNSIKEIREALAATTTTTAPVDGVVALGAGDLSLLKHVASQEHGLMMLKIPKPVLPLKVGLMRKPLMLKTPNSVRSPVATAA